MLYFTFENVDTVHILYNLSAKLRYNMKFSHCKYGFRTYNLNIGRDLSRLLVYSTCFSVYEAYIPSIYQITAHSACVGWVTSHGIVLIIMKLS